VSLTFVVSAVAIQDGDGRLLTVRKRGTSRFMNPGGKLEPGETPLQAAVREVREELGIVLDPADVVALGEWSAAAANEPGAIVKAFAFRAELPTGAVPVVAAEIEEMRWVGLDEVQDYDDLAPLLVAEFVPVLRALSR
jgi:8-oxo-dGTP pyrophosphatase MutT (NUDIX family)